MDFTGERYVPELDGQIRYEHLHRYALCLDLVAGKSVLDIASGEGYGAALLATVAGRVTGVDIDSGSVEHARHLYYNPKLTFVVGSCESIPLPDASFDVVTSFETIEHHNKHDEMLDEIKRVLRPSGTLIISSPNRLTYSDEPGYRNPFHVKELYYDEFHELLRRRFKSIRIFGQRLAAGSFVFPLGISGGTNLTPLTGEGNRVKAHECELPSPIYFVAVCSDDARVADRDISSIYFDRADDLLKTLERERLRDVQQMQEQVRRLEEEILRHKNGYESQIAHLNEEMLAARTAYETELRRLAAVLEERDNAIAKRDDEIARLRAHWLVSEKNILNYQENVRGYQRLLSEAQAQLGRHIEVLNWIYASRSWRISNSLRQVERLNERWLRSGEVFEGNLESPQSPVIDSLEIRGWVRSKTGPIGLVEAFLDDFYLGRIKFAEDRSDGYNDRISLHGLNLAGERTLRIRVYDQKGNKHVYTRPVIITAPRENEAKPQVALELFEGTLELPRIDAISTDSIEIGGWMYSRAGTIIFVEAFLNDSYLGRVTYGEERLDVLAAFPADAPLRCGYNKTFSLPDSRLRGQQSLKLKFYDEKGNTQVVERSMTMNPSPSGRDQGEGLKAGEDLPPSPGALRRPFPEIEGFERIITEFQSRMRGDPSILDWNSGFDLAGAFPHLAVFSPPANSVADSLPYLDHTIDIVVTASSDPGRIAEAERVAVTGFVCIGDTLEVIWRDDAAGNQLQTTSIIIPVYNEVAYTRSCLEQLQKTLPHNFRGEIIVVDDSSSDETPEVLKQLAAADERLKVLRNRENAGFIASCNRGAKEASGEILVFLNNDTLPMPGWLPPLLRVFQTELKTGAVGGKLLYPDGTLQEAGAVIFSDGSGCNFGKHDKAASAPLYSFLREVDYCSAALLATPRALFLDFGGFDTRFQPAYYEDADYCFTLRARGYRVYYQPQSVVVHFEGASSGTDMSTGVKSYQAVNRGKFVEKWKDILPQQPPSPQRYDFATLHDLSFSRSAANGYGK